VLNNLVSNACKFSSGGDTITLSIAKVEGGGLEFSVTDTGQGIPQEDLSKLFGRFEQASPRATKGERGSGLGLAIAKKIVELHGGADLGREQEGRRESLRVHAPDRSMRPARVFSTCGP